MVSSPSAKTAVDILIKLQKEVGSATLAYWVTPNSILTISGARAYCDGVFYHSSKKQLAEWTAEMAHSIEALQSLTDIYFAEVKVDKSTSKKSYAGYDVVFTQGLQFVLDNTHLLNDRKYEVVQQRLSVEKLVEAICLLLKQDERFKQYSFELKLTMPPTDRGGRGYSDKYVANAIKELQSYTQMWLKDAILSAPYWHYH